MTGFTIRLHLVEPSSWTRKRTQNQAHPVVIIPAHTAHTDQTQLAQKSSNEVWGSIVLTIPGSCTLLPRNPNMTVAASPGRFTGLGTEPASRPSLLDDGIYMSASHAPRASCLSPPTPSVPRPQTFPEAATAVHPSRCNPGPYPCSCMA